MARKLRSKPLRLDIAITVFVLGFVVAAILQTIWQSAHPVSCMPEIEIIEPTSTVSPSCLLVRHYVLIDVAAAIALTAAAWWFTRPRTDN